MFSVTGSNPHLIIIGRNSKLVFSYYGYIIEEDIRSAIEAALKEFEDLHQLEDFSSVFLDDNERTINLLPKFISLSDEVITYKLEVRGDSNVADTRISGSDLILTKGTDTGIEKVYLTASTTAESVTDSFSVMVYPSDAQIIDFEEGESWTDYFSYLVNEVWKIDDANAFNGSRSFRSGNIPAPDIEGEVNWTMARTEFYTDKGDTVAFAYKISSQYDSDGFEFYIDDLFVEFPDFRWTGEIDWTFAEYPVKAGKHSISWDYFKRDYGFAGMDAAWIDIVKIPGVLTSIETSSLPENYSIAQNYPNPFNSVTVLNFELRKLSETYIYIYNSSGQLVRSVNAGILQRGRNFYSLKFDDLESGMYLYRISAGKQLINGKMLYLK